MTCCTSYCLCDTLTDLWNVHTHAGMYVCMYTAGKTSEKPQNTSVKLASNVDKFQSGYLLHKILQRQYYATTTSLLRYIMLRQFG